MTDAEGPALLTLSALPPIGSVTRELCEDPLTGARVEVSRIPCRVDPAALAPILDSYVAVWHPSIASLLAVKGSEDGDEVSIVEHHGGGVRLSEVRLPLPVALLVAGDVADAVEALHRRRLRHGALDASAIELDTSSHPLVHGAGLAELQVAALGAVDADPRGGADDVREIGRLLYAQIAGVEHQPDSPSLASLIPTIDPALSGLVEAMVSRDPQRPPPPAGTAGSRLRQLAGVGTPFGVQQPGVQSVPAPVPAEPSPRRTDPTVVIAVAAIALAGVLAAFGLAGAKDGRPFWDRATTPKPIVVVTTTAPSISTVTVTAAPTVTLTATVLPTTQQTQPPVTVTVTAPAGLTTTPTGPVATVVVTSIP